jgi:ribose 5-phosphate isomerase
MDTLGRHELAQEIADVRDEVHTLAQLLDELRAAVLSKAIGSVTTSEELHATLANTGVRLSALSERLRNGRAVDGVGTQ